MTTASVPTFDVGAARSRFSILREGTFAFFDAPGGSLVPDSVADAIAETTRFASANMGGFYATSRRVEEINARARVAAAEFLGGEPENIVFGPNMTTINFALTRAAARDMLPGDEIIVTALDHDGGVAPWREVAADRGLVVKVARATPDLRVDLDHLRSLVTDRTRVIAFAWASNALGSIADAAAICELAASVGAISWVDAVHYAAHRAIDVRAIGADVLLCSPYKFCGPHLGMAHVEPRVGASWRAYKVAPRGEDPLGPKFETGTAPYELLAGLIETFAYLDEFGGFDVLGAHEDALAARLVAGLPEGVTLHGPALEHRLPTFLATVDGVAAEDAARFLAEREIGVWHHDHWYAVNLPAHLPFEGHSLRIGVAHYNTEADVDRLLGALADLAARG